MQSFDSVENSIESYLHIKTTTSHRLYLLVLIVLIVVLVALPFIYIDISVQGAGVIRPKGEKTEIKASVSELIDSVYVIEGQNVRKGDVLLSLRTVNVSSHIIYQQSQLEEYMNFISDLSFLVKKNRPSHFKSPVIHQEYNLYKKKENEVKLNLDKSIQDLNRHVKLFEKGIISGEEYESYVHKHKQADIELLSLREEQFRSWETSLNSYQAQYRSAINLLQQEEGNLELYYIKSPIDGTLDYFSGVYTGGSTRIGETLAIVSPDSTLYIEAQIEPKDIGYIEIGMPTTVQVEAFNYNEWGILKGLVSEISSDYFVEQGGRPYYKVKCKLDQNFLTLKNGSKRNIKKGMTVQTNFIITSRSLFQLLYMKVDDIFNPRQVQEKIIEN